MLNGESPRAEREQLDPEARARELLVFALRRLDGVDCDEFRAATGFTVDSLVARALARFADLGLLAHEDGVLKLTREGLLLSDGIWPEFLEPEQS